MAVKFSFRTTVSVKNSHFSCLSLNQYPSTEKNIQKCITVENIDEIANYFLKIYQEKQYQKNMPETDY